MSREVVIDARWLYYSGVGTYILNLLSRARRWSGGLALRALARRKDAARLAPFCDAVTVVDVPIYTLREQVAVPWAARRADLLHVSHYNAPLLHPGRLVVTIYDLNHITHPAIRNNLGAWVYFRPMFHLVARKAVRIITLSLHIKAQIVERLHVPPAKVTVIPLGVDAQFRPLEPGQAAERVRAALGVSCPYLLYVGNLKPHKNVATLLRAFARLRKRRALEHRLVLLGDDRVWKERLLALCGRLGIGENVAFLPPVSDDLLPFVYGAAELVVQPSWVEGFGLPVVEAMACGTPVVSSRGGALPEVAGDAAEFFDPSSEEDLADAIERVLDSAELQASLRRKGLERAKRFSWEDSARRHWEIYRELLS